VQAKVRKRAACAAFVALDSRWLDDEQRDAATRRLVSMMLHDPNSTTRVAAYQTLRYLVLSDMQVCMKLHQPILDALASSSSPVHT
jgi:hypothetical protein